MSDESIDRASGLEDDGPVLASPPVEDEEEPRSFGGGGNATLDFFLGQTPDRKVFADREIKRIGLLFRLEALDEAAFKRNMKRSEKKQTKQEKLRGMAPERDGAQLEKLMIVDSCLFIAKRIMSDEEAEKQGRTRVIPNELGDEVEVIWPYGDELSLRDETLLSKWGPRPEDFLTNWLYPGERTALADLVTDLSGFGVDVLSDPADAAKN